ncbi:hypothetical protein MTR67_047432 [Solanum verrucosum]|uniref:Transmembrane protein 50A n=1 Tax=Solanum verrucosum TaxID=315347 RepID=A0AAF0ZVL5_SOLVR|nr:hypothetical protein MTR67_047432 [Solanum verrucosum]
MDFSELWAIFGPGVSGAVFGAGWWFWVDAVVCSSVKISFLHYLPGIFASLAALMFNCVRKEDIDYSPYDEGEWRPSEDDVDESLIESHETSPVNTIAVVMSKKILLAAEI